VSFNRMPAVGRSGVCVRVHVRARVCGRGRVHARARARALSCAWGSLAGWPPVVASVRLHVCASVRRWVCLLSVRLRVRACKHERVRAYACARMCVCMLVMFFF